jgi:hypothetical protein
MEHGVKSEKREFFLYDVAERCDGPRTTDTAESSSES